MFRIHAAGLLGLLLVAGSAMAVDLATIERSIVKTPEFKTASPEYCLLVFGPEAAKRVWLIHDGDTLYVDRNGNGDLTEPNERVVAERTGNEAEGVFFFHAGAIPDAPASHECLDVGWSKLDYLRDKNPLVRQALEAEPNLRGCFIRVDVAMDGQRGLGVEGRVTHYVYDVDLGGVLRFSPRPADAPILHFGGPWQVTLTAPQVWQAGRTTEVDVALATPGLGIGSTVYIGYERVVPLTIDPKLQVEYPSSAGGAAPLSETYKLTSRCCGTSLYDNVRVPDSAGAGKAKLKISLSGAIGFFAAPTTHEIAITPARPRPSLAPVSARLKSRLKFSQPCGEIGQVLFAPDAKLLLASAYPEGVINVWNLENEERLAVIKTDRGLRRGSRYSLPSTDWRTLLVPTNKPEVFERVLKNGETFYRSEFADGIDVYDLRSGVLLRTAKHSPPQGSISIQRAGRTANVISSGYLPGEFKGRGPEIITLWNESLTESREIGRGGFRFEALSADGRQAAVSIPSADPERVGASLRLFRAPEFDQERTLVTAPAQSTISVSDFASGDRILVGSVTTHLDPEDFHRVQSSFKAWDLASGDEIVSIPFPRNCKSPWSYVSPDGRRVAIASKDAKSFTSQILLLDLSERTWKTLRLPDRVYLDQMIFHPSGSWLALSTQVCPEDAASTDTDALPQPRILILDVGAAKVIETLVSPKSQLHASAMSPGGDRLATGGDGEVLLWDVSDIEPQIANRKSAAKNAE